MIFSSFLVLSIFAAAARAGKRGLCWPWYNGSLNPGVLNNGAGDVVAIYDYETYQPATTGGIGNLGFIGMQRCTDCSSSPIADLYSRWQSQGWATVFTLNEPDVNGITASSAASWYIEYINALPIKKALPAVTSSTTSGQGLSWLSEMISACAGQCYFDYINLHWYGASFSDFQSYVESAHAQFPNYDLVITEFALQNPSGGQSDQVAFFQEAFSFLDSASYVTLYFPFVATSGSLFQTNDASGASYAGTGSCLYNDDGSASAAGALIS
ncbi:glycosyl hydrolase catalytic core-domain-containing protein [Chiua virens]|nr:glycosyl hydrolase catalytic core-domain-containing protein [Chiua virens]